MGGRRIQENVEVRVFEEDAGRRGRKKIKETRRGSREMPFFGTHACIFDVLLAYLMSCQFENHIKFPGREVQSGKYLGFLGPKWHGNICGSGYRTNISNLE